MIGGKLGAIYFEMPDDADEVIYIHVGLQRTLQRWVRQEMASLKELHWTNMNPGSANMNVKISAILMERQFKSEEPHTQDRNPRAPPSLRFSSASCSENYLPHGQATETDGDVAESPSWPTGVCDKD